MDPAGDEPTAPPEAYASAHLANVTAAMRRLTHPAQIGPYHVQQLIGEGGMGMVYRAEQRTPIHRIVAVKLIKAGMDTAQVIARFESERQALAMMNHVNVAKVLDAGATETGRPFFVMEYVAGEPITKFADRQRLTVRDRLALFTQACDAVQHAHQKAIIHRDLKPSNILVATQDDKPLVKVIDFGVAKAINQRLTERTLFTETGQFLGTPEYMSPEQAERSEFELDTRTDIYSLGVVLYELLAGALPFDARTLRSAGYNEIQRIIRDVDPPRPSTRLSNLGAGAEEIAKRRQTQIAALRKQLRGELEWIPLRAMHKERSRRYASAAELSEDIGNFLAQRPLRAAPDSPGYRIRKFVRRNRASVVTAMVIGTLLVGGVIATSWQAIRATRAERQALEAKQRAEQAAAELRGVNAFLTQDLLASASPDVNRGKELTVREALDRAAENVSERFKDHPFTEAEVHFALAQAYEGLGLAERALPHQQAATEIYRRERGPDDLNTLEGVLGTGLLLVDIGKHSVAEPMLQDALERSTQIVGPDAELTVNLVGVLAKSIRDKDRVAEAEALYRRVLDADRKRHGPRSDDAAMALNNLAVFLATHGRYREAEPLYREALDIRKEILGEDHPGYIGGMGNFARTLHHTGQRAEAEETYRWVLRESRRVLKDDHPTTTLAMNNLAAFLAEDGRLDECIALHREALERRLSIHGEDHTETMISMTNLGRGLSLAKQYEEAEPILQRAVELRRKNLGEFTVPTLAAQSALAEVLMSREKFAEAEEMYATLTDPRATPVIGDHQAGAEARRALMVVKQGDYVRAEPLLIAAEQRMRDVGRAGDPLRREVLEALVLCAESGNRPADAQRWRHAHSTWEPSAPPATHPAR